MAILLLAGFIYLPIFLRSFLCPRHAHVLNVYFGVFAGDMETLSQGLFSTVSISNAGSASTATCPLPGPTVWTPRWISATT